MTCTHCGRTDLTECDFYRDRNGRLSSYCRDCSRELARDRHRGKKQGLSAYTKEELLSRPIEHVLEVFSYERLAQIWGVSEPEVRKIMHDPWRVNAKTGEPRLKWEYRDKAWKALEAA